MKFLTLNTHSLQEENYLQKLKEFIDVILKEKPDIIAMQEVNQTIKAPLADPGLHLGYHPFNDDKISLRADNHAAQVAQQLRKAGISCSWTWISSKIGYDKYDEGMALLSLGHTITSGDSFYISKIHDYKNWKTRKVLGIQIEDNKDWFYTVHMGWWEDEEEPFIDQWKKLNTILQSKNESNIWIMGDFNSPSEIRGQGYDCVKESGWFDTYTLAEEKDSGFTVKGKIDGWKKSSDKNQLLQDEMRIDFIWCNNFVNVKSSKVVFNGNNEPIVSDHYGVMVIV